MLIFSSLCLSRLIHRWNCEWIPEILENNPSMEFQRSRAWNWIYYLQIYIEKHLHGETIQSK